jgi:gamma-glutamyl-gamma-aminobutyrate hydrolase PuuD
MLSQQIIKKDDMLILMGGTDINPKIYGANRNIFTEPSDNERDERDIINYNRAVDKELPILAICRGAQLACAINGGYLYQHSKGHNQSHDLMCKELNFSTDNITFNPIKHVAADHHQIMALENIRDYEVLAFDQRSTTVFVNDYDTTIINHVPEVVWFPKTKTIACQPHPEWMPNSHPFNVWLKAIQLEYFDGVYHEF